MICKDLSKMRDVKWYDVVPGDKVWLKGKANGEPCAYGPHIVVDISRRILRNRVGKGFFHYAEDLLTEEK